MPGSWRSSPTRRCQDGTAAGGESVEGSTRPASTTRPRRGGTRPAMTSSSVVLPAPDGPNSASRSPGAMANSARTVNCGRSTSTSTASTGAPKVGGDRQWQRDDQQDQGKRQCRRQPGFLQGGPDLQRKSVGM